MHPARFLPARGSILVAALVCALTIPWTAEQAQAATRNKPAAASNAPAPVPLEASAHADQLNADTATPLLRVGARGAAVVRAQILLDRAWFPAGEIDGIYGGNMARSVAAFQASRSLPASGRVDADTWAALLQEGEPLFIAYTLTESDVAGPYDKVPDDPMEQGKLASLGYESMQEALGERFHMSPRLLADLNRIRQVSPGATIVVANVDAGAKAVGPALSVRIDKSDRMLYVLGAQEKVLAGFPVSFGGPEDPLPVGRLKITSEVRNPQFTYNPQLLRTSKPTEVKTQLPAGPNNPAGVMWLGLSKPHWGIHGTNEPSRMARAQTNGCVRMTNWDVLRLASVIKPGVPVDVQE